MADILQIFKMRQQVLARDGFAAEKTGLLTWRKAHSAEPHSFRFIIKLRGGLYLRDFFPRESLPRDLPVRRGLYLLPCWELLDSRGGSRLAFTGSRHSLTRLFRYPPFSPRFDAWMDVAADC